MKISSRNNVAQTMEAAMNTGNIFEEIGPVKLIIMGDYRAAPSKSETGLVRKPRKKTRKPPRNM